MLFHELAKQVGINVPSAMTGTFYSRQHTFLAQRFDRIGKGGRIHFASAMTLLGYTDGTNYQSGVSYLDLVEFISRFGSNVGGDLEELWRRIVFYICVSNSDDHLRNHGFLLNKNGWTLSPAYDANPVETATGLTLNISEKDNALDLELAREVAPYFRVDKPKRKSIIDDIKSSVTQWRTVAAKYNISRSEQDIMSRAFRV